METVTVDMTMLTYICEALVFFAVADPGFHRGGANLLLGLISDENCTKNEKN